MDQINCPLGQFHRIIRCFEPYSKPRGKVEIWRAAGGAAFDARPLESTLSVHVH